MEIDADSKVCPICRYEFPGKPRALQWITLALIALLLLYFLAVG